MRIYTRTGDDGSTSLFDGTRIPKHHLRVEAYGTVDEANAALGHCARLAADPMRSRLQRIQHELFNVGGDLATPTRETDKQKRVPAVKQEDIARLEEWIDESQGALPPMKYFVLPGGSELACWLHTARVTARRAERLVTRLAEHEQVNALTLAYVNRLSDLLFSWCRLANQLAGVADVSWVPGKME